MVSADAMNITITDAERSDIDALVAVEKSCFQTDRLSRQSFLYALKSPVQSVKVARAGDTLVGYGVIHWRRTGRSARLYSLAVLERWRQNGVATMLVQAVSERACKEGKGRLTLEVRADSPGLVSFYQRLGFGGQRSLPAYYEDGTDALKMTAMLQDGPPADRARPGTNRRSRTIVVVPRAQDARHLKQSCSPGDDLDILTARQFLNATDRQGQQIHIVNLCPGDDYLGSGYYVSLIAEARANRILPSVDTLSGLVRRRIIWPASRRNTKSSRLNFILGKQMLTGPGACAGSATGFSLPLFWRCFCSAGGMAGMSAMSGLCLSLRWMKRTGRVLPQL